jgi:hypothetical protein
MKWCSSGNRSGIGLPSIAWVHDCDEYTMTPGRFRASDAIISSSYGRVA